MNYLSCMLRLIVCLCLGFALTATWAGSFSDDSAVKAILEREAEREADAAARRRVLDTEMEMIKKMWSCDPILHEEKIANWKLRQTKADGRVESIEEGYARLYETLLEFRGCQNEENIDQLREAFIEKYVCGLKSSNRPISEKDELDVVNKKPGAIQIAEYEDVIISGFIPCNGPKGKGAYYLDLKQHEAEARQLKVKSGAIPVSSFDDAVLFYKPSELWSVMHSPLLKPDNAIYGAEVILDHEEGKRLLRVKTGGAHNMLGGWVGTAYANIRLTKKTVDYSKRGMRIGGVIKVIGRYVQNMKYKTISGEEKIMPVIEAMYIGDSD